MYKRLKKYDLCMIIISVCCCLIGLMLIASMVYNSKFQTVTAGVSESMYIVKAAGFIVGFSAAIVLSFLGIDRIAKARYFICAAGLILVALTFTSLGTGPSTSDDRAWLVIFGRTVQPTELLKLCFIVSFSWHISRIKDRLNKPLILLGLLFHIAVPFMLCYLQGDQGTGAVFIIMGVIMLIAAGLNYKYIIGAVIASPVVIFIVWNFVLQIHQKERIRILFNPQSDPYGTGYQQMCGMNALKSGGLWGKGLFSGDTTDIVYVSEAQNDFIFSYAGQTLGFAGCVVIVGLLAALCIRLILDSRKCDSLGKSVCIGVFALFFTHTIINIGMVLGFMPVIGVPLPFISSGGTAMVSMLTATGLAQAALKCGKRRIDTVIVEAALPDDVIKENNI